MSCNYCVENYDGKHLTIHSHEIRESTGGTVKIGISAKYCPFCGESLTEPEPLTLEQLRGMDGEPVWIKEIEEWAIVLVDLIGNYAGMPFVKGKNFEYDVDMRQLTCYTRKLRREE